MILINNDLIWVSIPRCASASIESKLFNSSGLTIKYAGDYERILEKSKSDSRYSSHRHSPIDSLYAYFGYYNSICIKRDWLERWKSSLELMFKIVEIDKFTPITNFEDIDNDFIYKNFNIEFSNKLYSGNMEDSLYCYSKFIKEDFDYVKKESVSYTSIHAIRSQNYWKNNKPCTYEFDINEIHKFEKFIEDRYNIEFKLSKTNESEKTNKKIIFDDDLKNWIWKIFEYPLLKNKTLI